MSGVNGLGIWDASSYFDKVTLILEQGAAILLLSITSLYLFFFFNLKISFLKVLGNFVLSILLMKLLHSVRSWTQSLALTVCTGWLVSWWCVSVFPLDFIKDCIFAIVDCYVVFTVIGLCLKGRTTWCTDSPDSDTKFQVFLFLLLCFQKYNV